MNVRVFSDGVGGGFNFNYVHLPGGSSRVSCTRFSGVVSLFVSTNFGCFSATRNCRNNGDRVTLERYLMGHCPHRDFILAGGLSRFSFTGGRSVLPFFRGRLG